MYFVAHYCLLSEFGKAIHLTLKKKKKPILSLVLQRNVETCILITRNLFSYLCIAVSNKQTNKKRASFTLVNKIKETLNKWRDFLCSCRERFKDVKMSILPNLTCRLKVISMKFQPSVLWI